MPSIHRGRVRPRLLSRQRAASSAADTSWLDDREGIDRRRRWLTSIIRASSTRSWRACSSGTPDIRLMLCMASFTGESEEDAVNLEDITTLDEFDGVGYQQVDCANVAFDYDSDDDEYQLTFDAGEFNAEDEAVAAGTDDATYLVAKLYVDGSEANDIILASTTRAGCRSTPWAPPSATPPTRRGWSISGGLTQPWRSHRSNRAPSRRGSSGPATRGRSAMPAGTKWLRHGRAGLRRGRTGVTASRRPTIDRRWSRYGFAGRGDTVNRSTDRGFLGDTTRRGPRTSGGTAGDIGYGKARVWTGSATNAQVVGAAADAGLNGTHAWSYDSGTEQAMAFVGIDTASRMAGCRQHRRHDDVRSAARPARQPLRKHVPERRRTQSRGSIQDREPFREHRAHHGRRRRRPRHHRAVRDRDQHRQGLVIGSARGCSDGPATRSSVAPGCVGYRLGSGTGGSTSAPSDRSRSSARASRPPRCRSAAPTARC